MGVGRPEIPLSVVWPGLVAVSHGYSFKEAGGLCGVSHMTLRRRWVDHGGGMLRARKPRPGSLGLQDRIDIQTGLGRGDSFAEIGRCIGFSRGSIGREVNANGGRDAYRALPAQNRGDDNARRPKPQWWVVRDWLWDQVKQWLRKHWSPEQIAARLRTEHEDDPQWWVSHESIYQAIYVQPKASLRAELIKCLRQSRSRRGRTGRAHSSQSKIADMVNISQRPAEVEDRAIPGHWEGDLIIGAKGASAVVTLAERTTRFGVLIKLDNKSAAHVAERISSYFANAPAELVKSLTWDQGTELADHKRLAADTGLDVYFCDPHSPWQRGTNENFNGLARQYLPKGTDLSQHTQTDLDAIANELNGRPRKTLNWHTPHERITDLVAATA